MKGEALVSVSSIYKSLSPHFTPHSLCLSVDSLLLLKIFFTFRLPHFKKPFCVYLLSSFTLPFFSFCLSLTVCPSLPPCSLCVVLISDRFCSIPSVELKQQHKIQRKKENTLVNTTPQTFPFFLFDVFHLISLISHLPLTKSIDSVSEPVCPFFSVLMLLGGNFKSSA